MKSSLAGLLIGLAFIAGWVVSRNDDGMLSAQPDVPKKAEAAKGPLWKHAMELRVRPPGERDWANTPKISVEVFEDQNNGNLIYINDRGGMAVIPKK